MTTKILKPGQTGTVFIESIDCESVITRDLSDEARSKQAILDYAEAYRANERLPPVQVFLVDGKMVLVDGDHRIKGRIVAGKDSVVAECVGSGMMVEALLYALTKTNKGVGLRLSSEDCRHRVRLALESGAYDMTPASVIAKDLGISVPTVTKHADEWHAEREAEGKRGLSETVKDAKGREQPRRKSRTRKQETERRISAYTSPGDDEADASRMHAHTSPSVESPEPEEAPQAPETASPMPAYGQALEFAAAIVRRARLDAMKHLVTAPNHVVQKVEGLLKSTESAMKLEVPEVCPGCGGPGCKWCNGAGWLPRSEAQGVRVTSRRLGKETAA